MSCGIELPFCFLLLFWRAQKEQTSIHWGLQSMSTREFHSLAIGWPTSTKSYKVQTRVIWISFAPERAAAPSPRPWGPMGSLPMRKLCNQVGGVQVPTGHDTMGRRCPGVFGWWHRCMVQQEAATTLSEQLMLTLSCTEMAHIVSGICLRGSG